MQKGELQKVYWHLADGHGPKHMQQMLMEFVLNITPCAYNNPVKLLIKVALHKTIRQCWKYRLVLLKVVQVNAGIEKQIVKITWCVIKH